MGEDIEREIDRVLQAQRLKATTGDENALDVTTLNVAAHRLETLIHDRRAILASQQSHRLSRAAALGGWFQTSGLDLDQNCNPAPVLRSTIPPG